MLDSVERLRQRFGDEPLSPEEAEFLQDLAAFIDFAARNGLSFPLIINTLAHDLSEVQHHGSVEKPLSLGFSPKTKGYAQIDEDSVGQPTEPADSE